MIEISIKMNEDEARDFLKYREDKKNAGHGLNRDASIKALKMPSRALLRLQHYGDIPLNTVGDLEDADLVVLSRMPRIGKYCITCAEKALNGDFRRE